LSRQLRFESLEERALLTVALLNVPDWVAQGPSPAINGQTENLPSTGPGANPVSGAIQQVVAHPTDADTIYVGAVNGGVWRTTNATAANPSWEPLTDPFPGLSIGALEMDPTVASNNTLWAGVGRFSAFNGAGGPLTGVLRTTDGGDNWQQVAATDLAGRSISGIGARGNTVLVGANGFGGGVGAGMYRSTDGGATFNLISGTNGLGAGPVLFIAGDPQDNNRFYASVSGVGLFRTDDAGAIWVDVSQNDATLQSRIQVAGNNNTEMSVSPINGRVYVGVLQNGQPNYIGFSDNLGGTWTEMDLPVTLEGDGDLEGLNPTLKPGGQGAVHFSILADPTNVNLVYVGGDRQDGPFPNAVGANDFTARLFRGNTAVAPVAPGSTTNAFSPQWQHLTHAQNQGFAGGGTASGSAPHADSRDMVFNAAGDLIEVDDGGIYRRTSPQDNTGDWFSLLSDAAGGLQITEMHDVVYDTVANIIISGNQDTGTTEQIASGGLVWRSASVADGGDVVVDPIGATPNSIRYSSRQNLGGFRYRVMDAANNQVGAAVSPALNTGTDPAIAPQFVTPLAVNNVVGDRLIIGGNNGAYESTDRAENLTQVSTTVVNRSAIDYGGRRDGVDNPDVLYVGSGSQVLARTVTTFGALAVTAALPPGVGTIVDVLMHPEDWMTVFAIDNDQVFQSLDAGGSWSDITGNLIDSNLRSLEFVFDTISSVGALLAGGDGGIFRSITTSLGTWTEFGGGLPNAPVWDMDYDPNDDILVAGTLGRGAWSVSNASTTVFNSGVLQIDGDMDFAGQDDTILLVRNAANPLLLDVFVNGVLFGPYQLSTLNQINVNGLGGNDTLIVDSSNGLVTVPAGIRFDGGIGFDRLDLTQTGGPTRTSSTVNIGANPGDGQSVLVDGADTQTVFFQNLQPITDIVPAAAFHISSTPVIASLLDTGNAVTYTSGQILGVTAGRVTVDAFEPIEFSNKTNLVIDLGAGDDTFVANHSGLPTGLETITVNGDDGADVLRFEAVPNAAATSFVSVTVNGGGGDDVVDARAIAVDTPFTINGGAGADLLIGGRGDDVLSGGDGDDILVGGMGDANGTGMIGNNTYRGGTGFDTLQIYGTLQDDTIDVIQANGVSLNVTVNGTVASESLPDADVEEARIEARRGDDAIRIRIADAFFTAAADRSSVLRFHVLGDAPNASDVLNVVDDGLGDTILQRVAPDRRSGTIRIAPGLTNPVPAIVYEGIEYVAVTPVNPLTGGTGTDGLGRWVVFKPDPYESNNTLPTATYVGAGGTLNVDPTIDPGAGPLGIPGDEDFFQFVAAETGTLDYHVYFDALPSLANGRSGLPGDGILQVDVYDSDGSLIGTGSPLTDPVGNVIGRRFTHGAVRNQTYFLRVRGDTNAPNAVNVYRFTVMNVPAPVPSLVDLQAGSDTGRSDSDDVTRDTAPTFDILLDDDRLDEFTNLNLVPDTTDDDTPDASAHYGVQVFNNGVAIGYAYFTGSGNTWRFTAGPGDLLEGHNNFLSAAVWVRDRADPEQLGRGEWGPALQVTLDTIPPPVSIIGIFPASGDSGVSGYPDTLADRVTNDPGAGFTGWAEANSLVRLYVDAEALNSINNPAEYRLTVALPNDGDEAFPDGQWTAAFIRDLNDPGWFPFDGVREILVTAEDLAGNVNSVTDGIGDADQVLNIFIDTQGPQVTRVDVNSQNNSYELFDPKPSTSGPTPLVHSLVISVEDWPARSNVEANFLYEALFRPVAENAANYSLVGDHHGPIAIDRVEFTTSPALADGQPAEGYLTIYFVNPLPDDRFTLTLSDNLVDPAGNALDGESNTGEPQETTDLQFPSGDGQPGGAFVARFTVDSRPEIGVWAAGSVYVDSNGNRVWDPEGKDGDYVNRDLTYVLGFTTDNLFAGNFSPPGANSLADGFDKLAAYGKAGQHFRWLIDTDNDGVPNPPTGIIEPMGVTGIPIAGNFDGDQTNGDEVGLFAGNRWYFDTTHDYQLDTVLDTSNMSGIPIVGDFNGDGADDLGVWKDDRFTFLFTTQDGMGDGIPRSWVPGAEVHYQFGFIGVREKPVAAEMDGDGIDDIGLWVPDRAGVSPEENGEWYFLISGGTPWPQRIAAEDGRAQYKPVPLGNDLYASFGDEFALPIVGNFDPPVTPVSSPPVLLGLTNLDNAYDVDGDGRVVPLDALQQINDYNQNGSRPLTTSVLGGPFWDVNGDGWVTPEDILAVVNFLNQQADGAGTAEGESEMVSAALKSPWVPEAASQAADEAARDAATAPPRLIAPAVDLVFAPAANAADGAVVRDRLAEPHSASAWDDAAGWELEELLSVITPAVLGTL
jgi:hypothetical protein